LLFWGYKNLKFFDEDPGSGMETVRILDQGSGIRDGKKSDPGSGINIPDPQHCFGPRIRIRNTGSAVPINDKLSLKTYLARMSVSDVLHQRMVNCVAFVTPFKRTILKKKLQKVNKLTANTRFQQGFGSA
jgi:hypothetical protein